ncbi:hypothetical protein AALO_G00086160 [Alosa alosa]|uniref:Uncharacterized protein n=1 Tax=Alosa alosa TaxID=278164 RepID=A0AAV6H2A0_9TELE|nr:hypothetical protein AALO_G00086160 [Alosa alosa]
MPKINQKKFKIGVKKDSLKYASSKDETIETACSNTVSGFSSEDKPRRCNLRTQNDLCTAQGVIFILKTS